MTDDLIERLLPCPFCGGGAKLGGFKLAPDGYWISCQQDPCCASIDCFDTKEAAIATWNTRIATQQEAIDELEERCAKAIQDLRATIGADGWQSIALTYAEAAVRHEFLLSKHGERT